MKQSVKIIMGNKVGNSFVIKTSQAYKTLSWIKTLYLNKKMVKMVRIIRGPLFCFIVYCMKRIRKKDNDFVKNCQETYGEFIWSVYF